MMNAFAAVTYNKIDCNKWLIVILISNDLMPSK